MLLKSTDKYAHLNPKFGFRYLKSSMKTKAESENYIFIEDLHRKNTVVLCVCIFVSLTCICAMHLT